MSSLQKFHRRTASFGPPPFGFASIGSGNDTVGYWLGDISTNKLVVAPKSTEESLAWGSHGTVRSTVSTTDGLANTNTLYAFGNLLTTGHPAAYYCKTLATGGYNTWYLPAKNELNTMYSNKSATPFATVNSFVTSGNYYWSSTEYDSVYAWIQNMFNGTTYGKYGIVKNGNSYVRAVRRSIS